MDLRDDADSYAVHHVSQIGDSVERLLEKGTQSDTVRGRSTAIILMK